MSLYYLHVEPITIFRNFCSDPKFWNWIRFIVKPGKLDLVSQTFSCLLLSRAYFTILISIISLLDQTFLYSSYHSKHFIKKKNLIIWVAHESWDSTFWENCFGTTGILSLTINRSNKKILILYQKKLIFHGMWPYG